MSKCPFFGLIGVILWAKLILSWQCRFMSMANCPVRKAQLRLLLNCGLCGWVCASTSRFKS
jgi:hypothetical protein